MQDQVPNLQVQADMPIVLIAIIMLLAVASVVFWLWMLIDCIKNEPSSGNDKIIWVIVIVVLQFFGALLYYFIRRGQRIRDTGQ